jgi:uncharacterized protein (TIGR00255 family)
MTGFGRGAAGEGDLDFVVTAQGWNLRHLDLQVRLPEELRELEGEIRRRAQAHLARGRCEVVARRGTLSAAAELAVDVPAVERFLAQVAPLVESGAVAATLDAGDLARSPFLLRAAATEAAVEAAREPLFAALEAALAAFDADREREGAQLAASLDAAASELRTLVAALRSRHGEWTSRLRERARNRLAEILPAGADAVPEERLALEVLLLAERSDVSEELDRLESHLAAYAEAMAGEGPHGKRLDFWSQEILRELNTLGAKGRDAEVTRCVVEAKVINERFREQVQNVE